MTNGVLCIVPGDSVERALQSENILLEDFHGLTRADFIHGTLYTMREVGFGHVAQRRGDFAREMWFRCMERYDYWDVGQSSEEDELIAHSSFTYARYLLNRYKLDLPLGDREISIELINGDIYIYGKESTNCGYHQY